jgi:hypothetical protein
VEIFSNFLALSRASFRIEDHGVEAASTTPIGPPPLRAALHQSPAGRQVLCYQLEPGRRRQARHRRESYSTTLAKEDSQMERRSAGILWNVLLTVMNLAFSIERCFTPEPRSDVGLGQRRPRERERTLHGHHIRSTGTRFRSGRRLMAVRRGEQEIPRLHRGHRC